MSELIKKHCKEDGCTVEIDGQCFNNIPNPEKKCPHFYWVDDADTETNEEIAIEEKKSTSFPLFSGNDLSIAEINLVTDRYDSKLILIIGESEAGKTTILSSIFDIFQLNEFTDFAFAGSVTQIGFERRCHKSRQESNLSIPKTDKTAARIFNFLHLAIRRNLINERPVHLLLSDVSGEKLSSAPSSSSTMVDLTLLKIANLIVLLIDGEKIKIQANRQTAINKAIRFIQKALDDKMFSNKTDVLVLISKWDLIVNDNTFDYDKKIKDPFEKRFKEKLNSLSFGKVAARPNAETNEIKMGYGLEHLLYVFYNLFSTKKNKISHVKTFGNRNFVNYTFKNGH